MDLRLARDACRSYVINVDSLAGKPLQAYLYTHVLHGARQTLGYRIASLAEIPITSMAGLFLAHGDALNRRSIYFFLDRRHILTLRPFDLFCVHKTQGIP